MIRFLAAPAACLVLCGAAAAQDMPGLATLSPPEAAQPVTASPIAPDGTVPPGLRLGAVPDQAAIRPEPARTPPGGPALRSAASDATQTTASLKAPSAAPKPWCAQERRVGTGLGFCLVN
ncbi:hypothetical protein [Methylobacterium sp. P5_C11]